jgi:hypothetical protein
MKEFMPRCKHTKCVNLSVLRFLWFFFDRKGIHSSRHDIRHHNFFHSKLCPDWRGRYLQFSG